MVRSQALIEILRPLLEDERGKRLAGDALLARIKSLLVVRTLHYSQAHRTIAAPGMSAEEAARAVMHAYRSRNERR